MQLSAETFGQILKSLRSDAASMAGREQRKSPRVGVRGRSTIMMPAKSGPKTYPVNVRDISATGIGLLLTEPILAAGDEFILLLPAGGQTAKRQMLCGVMRFNKLSSNLFAVGASFKHEVAESGLPAAPVKDPPPRTLLPTQQISKELLDQADQSAVHEVEERLKRLSA